VIPRSIRKTSSGSTRSCKKCDLESGAEMETLKLTPCAGFLIAGAFRTVAEAEQMLVADPTNAAVLNGVAVWRDADGVNTLRSREAVAE
jgi:hypothetical protein